MATLPPEPAQPTQATLRKRLKVVATEQAEDADLAADLERYQGTAQADDVAKLIDTHTQVDEPMVLCAMATDARKATLVHSLIRYFGGRRKDPDFENRLMGALGDRKADGTDPPFVTLRQAAFEWKSVKLPTDAARDGAMTDWYADGNTEFFNATGGQTNNTATRVPVMGLLPAALGLKALKERMTPWEVYLAIVEFEESAGEDVKRLLTHTKNWCIAASMKGTTKHCSKMACQMTPVYDAPEKVAKTLAERLAQTIGRSKPASPSGPAPQAFPQLTPQQIATTAMQSMARHAAPSADALGDSFVKGVELAMRTLSNNASEEKHKGFTDTQKGKIMGWCGAGSWADVPHLWHEIEKSKSDDDLRAVLTQHWKQFEGNINVLFYRIYWAEELLTSLRKVTLTKSARATWATTEKGISPLLLMPRTEETRLAIEFEYQRRLAAGKNVTVADLQRAEREPRLPPQRYEELIMLLTTYALFLEMLFGAMNAHLRGVNAIRRELLAMADHKHLYDKWFYAQITWAIIDDGVDHFNQWMPFADIQAATTTRARESLVWPTTRLLRLATSLGQQTNINLVTFPREWTKAMTSGANGGRDHSNTGFNTGTGRGRGGGDERTGGGRGKGNETTGGGGAGGGSWRKRHPARYVYKDGKVANPHAPASLVAAVAPIAGSDTTFADVLRAAKSGHKKLAKLGGKDFNDNVCPQYSCGECTFQYCKSAHLYENEMPGGYAAKVGEVVKRGVAMALGDAEKVEPPAKRHCPGGQ